MGLTVRLTAVVWPVWNDGAAYRPGNAPMGKRQMKLLLSRFIREEHGSTALEYGLIAAGLSIAIVTVLAQIATTFARLKATAAAASN